MWRKFAFALTFTGAHGWIAVVTVAYAMRSKRLVLLGKSAIFYLTSRQNEWTGPITCKKIRLRPAMGSRVSFHWLRLYLCIPEVGPILGNAGANKFMAHLIAVDGRVVHQRRDAKVRHVEAADASK